MHVAGWGAARTGLAPGADATQIVCRARLRWLMSRSCSSTRALASWRATVAMSSVVSLRRPTAHASIGSGEHRTRQQGQQRVWRTENGERTVSGRCRRGHPRAWSGSARRSRTCGLRRTRERSWDHAMSAWCCCSPWGCLCASPVASLTVGTGHNVQVLAQVRVQDALERLEAADDLGRGGRHRQAVAPDL